MSRIKSEIKAAFLILMLLSLAPMARPQGNASGTIIVFRWSKNKIIAAVDSRLADDAHTISDKDCKISALSDHLFYISAGTRRFELTANGNVFHWDSHMVAQGAFDAAKKEFSDVTVGRLTQYWDEATGAQFNSLTPAARDEFGRKVQVDEPVILFAGFDEKGNVAAYSASVVFRNHKFQARILETPMGEVNSIGIDEAKVAVNDYRNEISTRAQADTKQWRADNSDKSYDWLDSHYIIQIVDWVINRRISKKVGGSSEAIELRSGGRVNWIKTCP